MAVNTTDESAHPSVDSVKLAQVTNILAGLWAGRSDSQELGHDAAVRARSRRVLHRVLGVVGNPTGAVHHRSDAGFCPDRPRHRRGS